MKTIDEQIASARRHLEMRKQIASARRHLKMRVSPLWIATGKMSQAKAEHEIACMEEIVETLEKVRTFGIMF